MASQRGQAAHRLRIPDRVAELLRGLHPQLKQKIRSAFEQLTRHPYDGKGLRQELKGLWSYRVGRFRIVYRITKGRQLEIVAVGAREGIYEETYRLLRRESR